MRGVCPGTQIYSAFKTSQANRKKEEEEVKVERSRRKKGRAKREKSPATTRRTLAVAKTHPSSSLATAKEELRESEFYLLYSTLSLFLGLWGFFSPTCLSLSLSLLYADWLLRLTSSTYTGTRDSRAESTRQSLDGRKMEQWRSEEGPWPIRFEYFNFVT